MPSKMKDNSSDAIARLGKPRYIRRRTLLSQATSRSSPQPRCHSRQISFIVESHGIPRYDAAADRGDSADRARGAFGSGYRLAVDLDRARAADDARAGLLLRRAGPVEEHPEHPDD